MLHQTKSAAIQRWPLPAISCVPSDSVTTVEFRPDDAVIPVRSTLSAPPTAKSAIVSFP